MSNVQTFEEWAKSAGYEFGEGVKPMMLECWQAAHENAARICESKATSRFFDGGKPMECAEAIREAANG